jgi:hypothetical protein
LALDDYLFERRVSRCKLPDQGTDDNYSRAHGSAAETAGCETANHCPILARASGFGQCLWYHTLSTKC